MVVNELFDFSFMIFTFIMCKYNQKYLFLAYLSLFFINMCYSLVL